MTLLHDAVEAKKLDTRMVERNISRGVIAAKDQDTALKALPDDSANAEYVSLESFSDENDSGTEH